MDQNRPPPRLRPLTRKCLFGRPDPEETRKYLEDALAEIHQEHAKRLAEKYGDWEPVVAKEVPTFYKKVRGQHRYRDDDGTEPLFAQHAPSLSPKKPEGSRAAQAVVEAHDQNSNPARPSTSLPSPAKKSKMDHQPVAVPSFPGPSRSLTRSFSAALRVSAPDVSMNGDGDSGSQKSAKTKSKEKKLLQPCLTNYLITQRRSTPRKKNEKPNDGPKRMDVADSPASPLRFVDEQTNKTITRPATRTLGVTKPAQGSPRKGEPFQERLDAPRRAHPDRQIGHRFERGLGLHHLPQPAAHRQTLCEETNY
ncbi:unnamed protein product, partial [Mesorhabditis spiculigera]